MGQASWSAALPSPWSTPGLPSQPPALKLITRHMARTRAHVRANAPTKTLVFVESPAKALKLQSFLGNDYKARSVLDLHHPHLAPLQRCQVVATFGHVRDLPTKDNAVKVGTKPNPSVAFRWTRVNRIHHTLKQVQETMQQARHINWRVVLATDPDREGEAIAWHLACVLEVWGVFGWPPNHRETMCTHCYHGVPLLLQRTHS